MKTRHNNPRHSYTGYLGIIILCIQTLWLHRLQGFTRPILHGLCTLGFAARAVIKSFCNGDPAAVRNIFGRFLLHVYPGETLVTEMWVDGQRVQYQTKAKERDRAVLSGYVLLKHIPSSLPRSNRGAPESGRFSSRCSARGYRSGGAME
uniref:MaoC-like domain-containing protein n=1 Tax=Aegilops tauschii subsp. strangulata TaxID=200361 RepID=A0A453LIH3_AEGTS